MNQKEWIRTLSIIALSLFILALGAFALNQAMGFFYKIQLVGDPCSFCEKLKTPNLIDWSNLNISTP